jgi:hypothetical protein
MASDLAQVIHLLRRSGFGGPYPEAADWRRSTCPPSSTASSISP